MKKLSLFLLILGLSALTATAAGVQEKSKSQPYAGVTITLLTQNGINMDTYPKMYVEAFEKETGIKVKIVGLPFMEIHTKLVTDFVAKSGQYDLVANCGYWGPEFFPAGYYEPIDKYLKDPKLANPNFNFNDFLPTFVDYACKWEGVLYGIPYFTDSELFFYRTDILAQAGLSGPPKTWTDFDSYCAKITGMEVNGQKIYGTTMDIADMDVTHAFIVRYCGIQPSHDLLTADKKGPGFANENGVKAVQMMLDHQKYSPPGVTSYDYTGAANSFTNGNVALHYDWSYIYGVTMDPEKSLIKGKVGAAVLPANPGCQPGASLGGWALTIGRYAKHKEAAFLFAQYIKTKEREWEALETLGFSPTRQSIFSDPRAKEKITYIDVLQASVLNGVSMPRVPQFTALMEVQASELQRAMSREISPEASIQNVEKAWKETLK